MIVFNHLPKRICLKDLFNGLPKTDRLLWHIAGLLKTPVIFRNVTVTK